MKFRAASIVIAALALSSPTLPLSADDKPATDKPADTKPAADKPPTDQPPATPPTGPRGGGFGRGGFGGGGAGRGGPGGFGGGAGGTGGGPGAQGPLGRFGPTIMRAQAQDPLDEIIQLLGELNLATDFTLSAEQKQTIQTARDEYKKQMDHWRADHADELKKLEDEMAQARAAIAQNAAAGQPANTRQNLQQIAQARQELTDTAPRSDETIVQIKGTLTTDQLKKLQAKETDRQAENEKLRQQIMQQQQQRLGRGGGFGGGGGGGAGGPGGGGGNGAAGGRGNPAGPGRGI